MTIVARLATTTWVVATLALTSPAGLWGRTPGSTNSDSTDCRTGVDERGGAVAGALVTWHRPEQAPQRDRLDRQCRTVGPMVLRLEPTVPRVAVTQSLVVISWNVHVGGGDIEQLLDYLSLSEPNSGAGSDYVLLLEEAFRSGALVPASIEAGVGVPSRIAPHSSQRSREDIVSFAQRRGLALYYVPSMRNGKGPPYEDRGNAILSTLPLADLTAIELPIDRQRRVAISATVQGVDARRRPWRLRLATVHLDAFAGARRLWVFATGWRGRQARTVIDALDQTQPAIIGADLNNWLGGQWEGAYRRFARVWPSADAATPDADAHGRLDYVFFRLSPGWSRESRRLESRFGSDHRPIVATIQPNE